MTVLKVRRPSPGRRGELNFQGRSLPVGAEVETRDYPKLGRDKWAQLIRQGVFYDDNLADPDIRRVLEEQRREFGDKIPDVKPLDPVVMLAEQPGLPPMPTPAGEGIACGDCSHVAKNAHGLSIHVSRKHKKE